TDYLDPLLALLGFETGVGSDLRHQQIPNAFAAVVRAEALKGPLALFIDDVHWLPHNGLRVVGDLLESSSEGTLFTLCSARPGVVEPLERWCAHRHVKRMQLSPLNRRSAEALVRQSACSLSTDATNAIVARAEGNPLFLRELALAGMDDEEASTPPTIEGVIQARLDREAPAIREFLRAGSIFGRVFWVEGVEKLLDRRRPVSEVLGVLESGRYIIREEQSELPGMGQWRFAHGLLSEVVYQSIPDRSRRAWHGRAGLWLSQEAPCSRAEDKARVAAHLAKAGDSTRASRTWYEAGEQALASAKPVLAQKAFEESIGLYDEDAGGLSRIERGMLYRHLAKGYLVGGELGRADSMLEESMALTHETEHLELSDRYRLRAEVLEANGRHDEAFEHVALAEEHALRANGDQGLNLSLEMRRYAAWLSYRSGRLEKARVDLEALVTQIPADANLLRGRALNLLGVSAYGLGDYTTAEQHLNAARELLSQAADSALFDVQRALAATYNNLGMLAMRMADRTGAARWYELAVRVHAKTGNRASLARTYGNLGSLYGEMGDYERAEAFMREDIRIKLGTWESEVATGYANLGKCLLLQHRHDEAEANLRKALKLIDAGRGPQFIGPDVWKSLAELLLERAPADVREALDAARRALSLAEDAGDQPRESAALRTVGRVLLATGAVDEARAYTEKALTLARKLELPLEIARCLHEVARLAFHEGHQSYTKTLAEAYSIFDERNVPRPESFNDSGAVSP
ncbi:MAG: tetratricopeptide repeat protein, partial [Myxococcota bacterium]|nr:tetratricopeptide repeat protein [Myxococcota bacterium]